MTKEYGPINPKFIPCANATAAPVEEAARAIAEKFVNDNDWQTRFLMQDAAQALSEYGTELLRQHGYGAQVPRCPKCGNDMVDVAYLLTVKCWKCNFLFPVNRLDDFAQFFFPVPSPAAAPKWNPIATAPKNASEMRVKMRDGTIHEKAHWAEDLSGSDQPPFQRMVCS